MKTWWQKATESTTCSNFSTESTIYRNHKQYIWALFLWVRCLPTRATGIASLWFSLALLFLGQTKDLSQMTVRIFGFPLCSIPPVVVPCLWRSPPFIMFYSQRLLKKSLSQFVIRIFLRYVAVILGSVQFSVPDGSTLVSDISRTFQRTFKLVSCKMDRFELRIK
jgi:hypothetical protein